MSRWEFMRQLEELLSDIPPGEREEALQYYNDYFNDAGGQSEQEVIEALGTPEQVAQIVKDGISGNGESGEFTENGFSSASYADRQTPMKRAAGSGESRNKGGSGTYTENAGAHTSSNGGTYDNSGRDYAGGGGGTYTGSSNSSGNGCYNGNHPGSSYGAGGKTSQKEGMPAWVIVLIVLGCIVLSPVIISIIGSVFGVIVGIFGTVFGLIFGIGLAVVILFVVAAALIVAGFGCLWAYPMTGIGLLGGGLICASLGIMFLLFEVFLVKCIPGICKGIKYIYRSLVGKKGGAR